MESQPLIFWLDSVTAKQQDVLGTKAVQLANLMNAGIPVPAGFCISAQALNQFLEANNLVAPIKASLAKVDAHSNTSLFDSSREIKRLIHSGSFAPEMTQAIAQAYARLSKGGKLVAVRSSGLQEDIPHQSFAGQYNSILSVAGEAKLQKAVLDCWASLFNARSLFYHAKHKRPFSSLSMAVIVQIMAKADVSGVMFTANPLSQDRHSSIIEAVWGLGDSIVKGSVIPDHYEISHDGFRLTRRELSRQTLMLQLDEQGTKQASVPASKVDKQKLGDELIVKLAKIGQKVETLFGVPQDIEWSLVGDKLWLLQSRPITTMIPKDAPAPVKLEQIDLKADLERPEPTLTGTPASPGIAKGTVVMVTDQLDKLPKDAVLVATKLKPELAPLLHQAVALVTEQGGQSSHAAILSRELNVPTVIQAKGATRKLKAGEAVTVDAQTGRVYTGNLEIERLKLKLPEGMRKIRDLKTHARIYVALSEPELAKGVAHKYVDGIGLLKAEFLLTEYISQHPRAVTELKKDRFFVRRLSESIEAVVSSFYPRPVFYRLNDLTSREYRQLLGAKGHEVAEANPLLGLRGAARYLEDTHSFNLELKALSRVRNELGFKNIHIVIPFVRTPQELKAVKKLLHEQGLGRKSNCKLYLSADIPNNIFMLDEFIDAGIDGIMADTNDLSTFIMGVDPENTALVGDYAKENQGLLKALEIIVRTCARRNIACSVTGNLVNQDSSLVSSLLAWGATSLTVEPLSIDSTRVSVYQAESAKRKPTAKDKTRSRSLSMFQRLFKK